MILETFTPFYSLFGAPWKYFRTFCNVMNGQPYCIVEPSRFFNPLVAPAFWNTDALTQATTFNISRQDHDIFCKSWHIFCIFLCSKDWYDFLGWSNYYHRPCFFKKSLWISSLFRLLSSLFVCYGNDKTRTQNRWFPYRNLICFAIPMWCSLLESKAFEFESHLCHDLCEC